MMISRCCSTQPITGNVMFCGLLCGYLYIVCVFTESNAMYYVNQYLHAVKIKINSIFSGLTSGYVFSCCVGA